MPTPAILLGYQERILSLHTAVSQLRIGQMTAFAVMTLSVIFIALLAFFAFARKGLPPASALLPLPVAIYAGKAASKRNRMLLETLRLQTLYQRGVDRLEGRWAGSGITGDEMASQCHPFAKDLSVFGEGSLFEFICTCRTEVGRRHLAQFFLSAPTVKEIRRRQDAVRELQNNIKLRERLHLLGKYSFQESTWTTISEWLESPVARAPAWFRALALTLSIFTAILALLRILFVVSWSQIALPMVGVLLISGLLALAYRKRLLASQPAIRALSLELEVLRQGLALLQSQTFVSPLLSELVASVAQSEAATQVRQLERLAGILRERDKEWFYHASRGLLVGTQAFLAIEKWRVKHGADLRRWLPAWGEFEALMALATYAYEHPHNAFPQLAETGRKLECVSAGHPLLPMDACVRNDICWDDARRFYVISGSNMAGKSTLLRTIGLNLVLAYAGAPVCAERMTASRLAICASIAVQDSLLNGKSKFMAEMERIKLALNVPSEEGPVLFLVDEILSGTNSKDRRMAAEAILRALLQLGAVGALSTHDLALTELAELPELAGANIHMGSRIDSDPMDFDYLLKPGITNQSSALAIARLAGVAV